MLNKTDIQFIAPSVSEYELVKQFISDFDLDNRGLKKELFVIAKQGNDVIGFGRIRRHFECNELCSLGVIHSERLKGIGKQLVKELIEKAKQSLYLVCIIPEFFEPFGFVITEEYPTSIEEKLEYCTSELSVPEKYVVMIHKNMTSDHF